MDIRHVDNLDSLKVTSQTAERTSVDFSSILAQAIENIKQQIFNNSQSNEITTLLNVAKLKFMEMKNAYDSIPPPGTETLLYGINLSGAQESPGTKSLMNGILAPRIQATQGLEAFLNNKNEPLEGPVDINFLRSQFPLQPSPAMFGQDNLLTGSVFELLAR